MLCVNIYVKQISKHILSYQNGIWFSLSNKQQFHRLIDIFVDNLIGEFFDNGAHRRLSFWEVLESDVDPSFRYPLRLSLTISRPEGSASQEEQNRRSTGKIEENKMKGGRVRWGYRDEVTATWRRILHDSLCTNYQVTPSCRPLRISYFHPFPAAKVSSSSLPFNSEDS